MENSTQKTALNESLKAEAKRIMAKKAATTGKKMMRKPQNSKPAVASKKGSASSKPASKKRTTNAAAANKSEKKHHREKIVRDSFTMPENEYDMLATLKKKCLAAGVAVKKSELLRAGLKALSEMSQAGLNKQLSKLREIKMGRPSNTTKK